MNELPIEIVQQILGNVPFASVYVKGTLNDMEKCYRCLSERKKCKHANLSEMRTINSLMLVCSMWHGIIKSMDIQHYKM